MNVTGRVCRCRAYTPDSSKSKPGGWMARETIARRGKVGKKETAGWRDLKSKRASISLRRGRVELFVVIAVVLVKASWDEVKFGC